MYNNIIYNIYPSTEQTSRRREGGGGGVRVSAEGSCHPTRPPRHEEELNERPHHKRDISPLQGIPINTIYSNIIYIILYAYTAR